MILKGNVIFWADGEMGKTVAGDGQPCICMSARGNYAVAGFGSGHIRMYDVSKQTIEVNVILFSRCFATASPAWRALL